MSGPWARCLGTLLQGTGALLQTALLNVPGLSPPRPPPPPLQICFVGDEAFRQLSQVDDNAPTALSQAMARDGSREWLGNRRQKQEAAAAAAVKGAGASAAAAHAAPAKGSPTAAAAAKPASPPAAAAPAAAPAAARK